jgi:hypothetical protein
VLPGGPPGHGVQAGAGTEGEGAGQGCSRGQASGNDTVGVAGRSGGRGTACSLDTPLLGFDGLAWLPWGGGSRAKGGCAKRIWKGGGGPGGLPSSLPHCTWMPERCTLWMLSWNAVPRVLENNRGMEACIMAFERGLAEKQGDMETLRAVGNSHAHVHLSTRGGCWGEVEGWVGAMYTLGPAKSAWSPVPHCPPVFPTLWHGVGGARRWTVPTSVVCRCVRVPGTGWVLKTSQLEALEAEERSLRDRFSQAKRDMAYCRRAQDTSAVDPLRELEARVAERAALLERQQAETERQVCGAMRPHRSHIHTFTHPLTHTTPMCPHTRTHRQELEAMRLKKRLISVRREASYRRLGELSAVPVSAAARGYVARCQSDASVSALVRMGMWAQEGPGDAQGLHPPSHPLLPPVASAFS